MWAITHRSALGSHCASTDYFLQACAALEKQLKFATDRIERADEEKKELQEVLRAWEAENLRLRTQVVKLMEQQVHVCEVILL